MKKLALLIAGLVCVGLVSATPPVAEAALGTFVPRSQNIFNVPRGAGGTVGQQYGLSTFVESTLDAMAPGSVARIATYELNVPSSEAAILRAAERGVNVRVIFDKGNSAAEQRVMAALGSDVRANKSYAIACDNSCNSAALSSMHSKLALFSSTGAPRTAHHISVIGSANLTSTNQYLNWNQSQVLTDPDIYVGLIRFFDQMRFDSDDNHAWSTFRSQDGRYRAYLWPSGSRASDVYLSALRSIKSTQCRGTAKGYGNAARRTVIRIDMFLWSGSRGGLADELVRLHKAGCDVAVAYVNNPTAGTMAQSVATTLYKGGVPLYNTRRDLDGDGTYDLYSHGKRMLINGTVYGHANKLVWNGSANWTLTALVHGNEAVLRTDDDATYDAFQRNFNQVLLRAHRETRLPVTEARPSATQRRVLPDDQDVDAELQDLGRL